ncbi:Eco57I restriction-modification methylase domain-containing protein [Amycolatopsis ultiminotia]
MSSGTRQRLTRQRRASGDAQQHRGWLSMIDVEGPFLSLPVLRQAWPTLDSLDKPARDRLRLEHKVWQADPANRQRAWIKYVLGELLDWDGNLQWAGADGLASLAIDVPEHEARVVPTFALVRPGKEAEPAFTELVGLVCPPGQHPSARIADDDWAANSVDRLVHLCRRREVQLGLVTDGRWWTLVWARNSKVATTATFDAIGWPDAAEREVVRAFVSLLCRRRFFGVPESDKIVALLAASEGSQEEITETLGVQVRQAVELLVSAIGRADTAQRERGEAGLTDVDAKDVYRAAVTVMMRIVFLLFAEERKMLPSDNELYASSYSVGRLCGDLERRALESSEDDLEHSFAAWHRLLALFEAVYYGIDHPRLTMNPHDGSLFDTTSATWFPRSIDDRTILHMLRAVQFIEAGTGSTRERRKLSFRELQVEQIGYVYEGLLAHDGFRAGEVTVSLIGKQGYEQEVALADLEALAAESATASALGSRLSQEYKASGIGSPRVLERKLAPLAAVEREDTRRRLLAATRGDNELADRLMPFARLIRDDLRGLPIVIRPGELFVTDSPLRRLTGTHYTPRHLAELVVKDALEPLVYSPGPLQTNDRAKWVLKRSNDILALKVADIAMGSGAFLVSAAHFLAERLVEAWTREGDEQALLSRLSRAVGDTDEDPVIIKARRQVIEHCLYGVDINPSAVEITKVSLWLISMDPDLPFTFLDDRLKTGDSLLGIRSLDQLWHMHLDPEQGRKLHLDLFQWVAPGRALMSKVADARRQVIEIDVRDDPLVRLAEKRKLLEEIHKDTAELRRNADLLVASALANAKRDARGITNGAVEAARLSHNRLRDLEEDGALTQAYRWLSTDAPEIGFRRRPFHWPLEFPEVFEHRGGFDAIIGNQPYLGGQKLTGALGEAYREYLVHTLAHGVRGSADLIAYFVLRSAELINDTGTLGLVATNTLAQGDTRQVGLDQAVANGLTIYNAIKSMPWPSRSSALECCVVWGSCANVTSTVGLTAGLEPASRVIAQPRTLAINGGISFQGSNILGLGFTMTPVEADRLIGRDPKNSEVLFPYLNGQDLNSNPRCSASRWVINFHNWPEDRAKAYRECYGQVLRLVKPERDRNNRKPRRERWWQYAERTPELVRAITGLERVVVITLVSKTVMPVMVPTKQVFAHKLGVFASADTALLAFLSSAPHYWWTVRRSSTMKTDINYSPSDVFETLPLPELTQELRHLGDQLDTFRRDVMLSRQTGLTKTYNLVFDENCRDQDIEELRALHREIDEATVRAYGWQDRVAAVGGLDHGFHQAGRETRYTIGPAAQREILDSLLELNHERYAEEDAKGLHIQKRRSGKIKKTTEGGIF